MDNNSVILFTDNEESISPLVNLLNNNYRLHICTYSSDSWNNVDFYNKKISVFIIDDFAGKEEAMWIFTKLSEDGVFSEIPILFTSFETMYEFEKSGFTAFAYDVLPEPFVFDSALRRLSNIIEIRQLKSQIFNLTQLQAKHLLTNPINTKEQDKKIQSINYELIELLVAAIESRDLESGQHIKRIKYFVKAITNAVMKHCPEYGITKEDADYIYHASSVHDIGKIAIPDAIMLKKSRLSPKEYEIMKTHTVRGAELLGMLDNISDNEIYFKYCQDICRYHHERWDGSGYPDGLKGDEIPVSAQIVSIADCYDALVTERPYKTALSSDNAADLILSGSCGAFSPQLLNCFVSVLSELDEIDKKLKNSSNDKIFDINQSYLEEINSKYIEKLSDEETAKQNNNTYSLCEESILSAYDIMFSADIKNGFFEVIRGDWSKFFMYVPKNFSEFVNQCHNICHPADIAQFSSKMNIDNFQVLARSGIKKTRIEFRVIKDGVEHLVIGFVAFITESDSSISVLNCAFSLFDVNNIPIEIGRRANSTDSLTGLSLQKKFKSDVDSYIKNNPDSKNIMVCIDIDDMSMCNNVFGYEYGNELIKEFSYKLRNIKSNNKLVCKYKSDKFLLFAMGLDKQTDMVMFVEELHNILRKQYHTATENGYFTASMGISRYPNDGSDYVSLVNSSEYALQSAKINGTNSYAFYNSGMKQFSAFETKTRNISISETSFGEFEPKFVPVVDAKSGNIVCYDYVPFSSFDDSIAVSTCVYYELNKKSSTKKNLSLISLKTLLLSVNSLQRRGKKVPPISVYTMFMGADIPGIVQDLKSYIETNGKIKSEICILLPQDILEDVTIRKLKTFSSTLKEMGFSLGLYLIGTRYIHNSCYVDGIFDRYVITSEYVDRLVASGDSKDNFVYAASTINNLHKFSKVVSIPKIITDFEASSLINAGAESFTRNENSVVGAEMLMIDYYTRKSNAVEKAEKPFVSYVDSDLLYYDINRNNCFVVTYDITLNKIMMSENINQVIGFDVLSYYNKNHKITFTKFIHPDDLQDVLQAVTKVRTSSGITDFTVRLATGENEHTYNNFKGIAMRSFDEMGTPTRIQCMCYRAD
ncbi:MAG: HD domain-containing phosphohydrolase [Acutalibacteraceae bacterium]